MEVPPMNLDELNKLAREVEESVDDEDEDDLEEDLTNALKLLEDASACHELSLDKEMGCILSQPIKKEVEGSMEAINAFLKAFETESKKYRKGGCC
jgi:hypothetical protein